MLSQKRNAVFALSCFLQLRHFSSNGMFRLFLILCQAFSVHSFPILSTSMFQTFSDLLFQSNSCLIQLCGLLENLEESESSILFKALLSPSLILRKSAAEVYFLFFYIFFISFIRVLSFVSHFPTFWLFLLYRHLVLLLSL